MKRRMTPELRIYKGRKPSDVFNVSLTLAGQHLSPKEISEICHQNAP